MPELKLGSNEYDGILMYVLHQGDQAAGSLQPLVAAQTKEGRGRALKAAEDLDPVASVVFDGAQHPAAVSAGASPRHRLGRPYGAYLPQ